MEPAIHWGDMLVVAKPPAQLEPGMIVTMNVEGRLVTHRVVSVNPLVTKGDANENPDRWQAQAHWSRTTSRTSSTSVTRIPCRQSPRPLLPMPSSKPYIRS